MEGLLRLGFFSLFCLYLGFSGLRQGLGFRRVEEQGFFTRSLPEQEVPLPWLLPCFQAGKRPQVKPGSLARGHRWLPVSPVVRLERQGCRALACGSPEGGVCDSLSHTYSSVSDSHHPGFVVSPSLSRGGLWTRRFRLFAARERWSLCLQLQASSAACLL